MKVYIRQSASTPTGYELVSITDENIEVVRPIEEIVDEGKTLKLPENESNRKYFNIAKIEKAGGTIELTYKESITLGPKSEQVPRKGLEEYLEGDDKELYLALIEKAKKNREEVNKKAPMSEVEKARRAYERALTKYENAKANA